MYFKRKAYNKLLEWKKLYSDKYAVLLEGARRVGKSTIAENFAKNEYKSYILIDFSKVTDNILDCFEDIGNLNIFFLRLQAETGITLYEHDSLIIFDEVQLFPKARQAIKHLVSDGRYSYLETGSLISIRKNVKEQESHFLVQENKWIIVNIGVICGNDWGVWQQGRQSQQRSRGCFTVHGMEWCWLFL